MVSIIALVLNLLAPLLESLIKNKAGDEVIQGVQDAVNALQKVQGSPVTQAQLESFRYTPQW
jgi:hypothetical protein